MIAHRLTAALVLVLLAGCSAQQTSSQPASGGAGTGTLQGALVRVGGPDPGSIRPLSGTVVLSGAAHETLTVGADGRYSTSVPAGSYQVAGFSPSIGSGAYRCEGRGQITVTRDHTTHADIYCQVR